MKIQVHRNPNTEGQKTFKEQFPDKKINDAIIIQYGNKPEEKIEVIQDTNWLFYIHHFSHGLKLRENQNLTPEDYCNGPPPKEPPKLKVLIEHEPNLKQKIIDWITGFSTPIWEQYDVSREFFLTYPDKFRKELCVIQPYNRYPYDLYARIGITKSFNGELHVNIAGYTENPKRLHFKGEKERERQIQEYTIAINQKETQQRLEEKYGLNTSDQKKEK